jgi:hypothetical protein
MLDTASLCRYAHGLALFDKRIAIMEAALALDPSLDPSRIASNRTQGSADVAAKPSEEVDESGNIILRATTER